MVFNIKDKYSEMGKEVGEQIQGAGWKSTQTEQWLIPNMGIFARQQSTL